MALTKSTITAKIEIVTPYKHVQCKEATIIKEDGVEISRSYKRHVLTSSSCVENEDGTFTHTDTDISGEPAETQAVCVALWTDAVKAAWKTFEEEHAGP
jgi:hypothetical protein